MATKDYKARDRVKPRHGRRGGSGFFWFVTGSVFGAFGIGLAWTLSDRMQPGAAPSSQVQAEPATKPSFVFHQLLPELEVLVPDEELGESAQLPKPAAKSSPQKESTKRATVEPRQTAKTETAKKTDKPVADGASYLVQVASFRQASDAERLKAKLALLGVRVRVQRVTVNGKDYHRVRAGPYKGKQEVNKTRALLSSNGLESIAIKLK